MTTQQSNTATYEGWSSRETWNVMLWLDNDYNAYQYYTERIKSFKAMGQTRISAYQANAIALSALGSETGDGISLSNSRIKWSEIATAMMAE